MADNLIFPIGFDLEKGVKDVISRSDTYLRQIEHAMNRKPIVLRAEVDASKFQMFSRQFTNSIDGISAKLAQAQRLWNAMTFDVKFDADGNLSRRAQVVFDAFQQLTQASATMGQRLGEVNRNLAKSEQDTARAITAEYDKRRQQVNEQIRLKERQAAAEERVRQGQLKGVNVGYVETQRQVEAVRNLRLQYEAILPMLNAMAQRRYDIKVGIDKQFEADIQRINAEIARLRQSNLQLGAKGDTNAIQANLQAIRHLEAELQRISQQKIDLLNSNKINSDLARLRTEISSVFGELQSAERRLATDNSLNAALDAQSQKVLKLHADIQKLDQQFAQLNATGKAYNQDGSFTTQANTLLQQRIALTKQLEQEAITGQQAQIKLEQQLREEKRQTEQAAKNAAKEAERQAKAEAAARKQAQDAANAENKARQEAYNARRRQGQETQRILNKEAKSIADITAKLQIQQQRLQSTDMNSKKFNKIAEEVKRLTADLEKANQKMRELTGQTQSGAARQSAAVKQVSNEFKNQETYVSRLIKRMAVYASFSYVGNFLTSIREITAQFELQRVSLGAIIQDQNKANQLFSEIKSFALKSSVSILDLTKYTKQLAAYKIGYDELFETTKKLTDVSVGLGVSMDRVVLAYGQVRATGHLRASEVRQFTEMGVPIVEELAAKLSKMNGEMVTSAQVMDMISKRAISFDMVKEVFDDMTSAGGVFYNMQEKQGNTLYGLWAKLGDAASVMYSEIGNTGPVNNGMKSLISGLTSLMKNWRLLAGESMVAVASFGAYKAIQALTVVSTEASTKATQRLMAAKEGLTAAQNRLTAAQRLGNNAVIRHANLAVLEAQWTVRAAAANRLAANATNVWTAAKYRLIAVTSQLKAAVAGNWIMLTVAAVAAIGVAIAGAIEKATRLKRALDDIQAATINLQNQSVGRFEHLAEAAVNAADGSKKQRDALAELSRTYGDILPQDALKLENLKKLNHNYAELTTTLKEYIAVQQKNKGMEEISNEYGGKINEASKKAIDSLVDYVGVERDVAINIVGEMQRDIQEKLEKGETDFRTTGQKLQAAAEKYGVKISDSLAISMTSKNWYDNWYDHIGLGKATNEFQALTEAVAGQYNKLDEWNKRVDASTGAVGAWSKELEAAKKKIDELPLTNPDGSPIDNSTFQGSQIKANETMKVVADLINNDTQIKDAIKKKEVEWNNDWIHLVGSVDPKNLMNITAVNFDAIIEALDKKHPELADKIRDIQKEWGNVAPTNATAVQIKYKMGQISDAFGVHMDKMQKYLWDGSGSVDDYLKRLKQQQEELNARLKEKQQQLLNMGVMSKWWNKLLGKDIEAEVEQMKKEVKALDTLIPFVTGYTVPKKDKSKGGTKSDPRLQNLKEEISLYEKLYQEYKQYEKAVGSSKAAEYMEREAKDTIDALAKKYGIGLPKNVTDLTSALEILYKKMQALPSKVFKNLDKELKEFRWKIEKVDIDESQKNIEAELKRLSDRISRTKTAKEFYEKILGQTGDIELATRVSLSVYGSTGKELFEDTVRQIREVFKSGDRDVEIDLSPVFDMANQRIDYKALADIYDKYQDQIIEKNRSTAENIVKEGQKAAASNISTWEKELAKAKDYEEQRTDIINRETHRRAEIYKSNLPQEEKDRLAAQSQRKQDEDLAKVNFEEFTKSEDYIKIFENLDNVATSSLKRLRAEMQALIDTNQNLSPENMKTLVKAMEDIDEQISERGFGNDMIQSVSDYIAAIKNLKIAKQELTAAEAEYQAQLPQLDEDIATAEDEKVEAQRVLNDLKNNELATKNQIVAAELRLNTATANVAKAEQAKAKAADKVKKAEQKVTGEQDKQKKATTKFVKDLQKVASTADQLAGELSEIKDLLGISEDSAAGLVFDSAISSLQTMSTAINAAATAQAIFNAIAESNPYIAIAAGVLAVGSAIASWISGSKVRKANKEIKRQQELLDQLEYTYGRLEKAADKLFGRDYVNNYNQQLKNLQAQQTAYLKQAEAERSKGKKADEEKIKEYEEQARETADKIKEMQDDLVAHFTGSTKTDVARQMAKSWVDARASMSDTFAAIKGDYADMVKNMLVEGAAARVIENALSEVWDDMDAMLAKNDVQGAIDSLVNGMDSALTQANNGMEVLWKALEARGYDMKKLIGDTDSEYTGMAKSVAGATSEEINNVAAIGNTLMYYVSPIPRIDENLAAIRAIMERGGPATSAVAGSTISVKDYTDMFNTANRHLSSLPTMERHLSEIRTMLGRIITTEGRYSGVNTFMRK